MQLTESLIREHFDQVENLKAELTHLKALVREMGRSLINLIEWVRLDIVEMQREGHVVSHLVKAADIAQAIIDRPEVKAIM